MKKQLLLATAVLAFASISSLASAGDDKGVYVRGNVGYGAISSVDLNQDLVGDIEGKTDLTGSAALGYEFGNNWRVELDVAQLWNDMGAINQNGDTLSKLRLSSGMLNAIYDFNDFGRWEPYFGAGVGMAEGRFKAQSASSTNVLPPIDNPACPSADHCAFDAIDQGFAWQLFAGLGYDLTDSLTWDTYYRYLNAGSMDYLGKAENLVAPGFQSFGPSSHVSTTLDGIDSHAVLTGFRYRFGAKPAAQSVAMQTCWDGVQVEDLSNCTAQPPVYIDCWDGSQVVSGTACPVQPSVVCWDGTNVLDRLSCPVQPATITCWDGSLVYDRAACPIQQTARQIVCPDGTLVSDAAFCAIRTAIYNNCGPSNVAIFNVTGAPKSINRLGTLPEFGDSHDLSPTQFFEKLQQRYASSKMDRSYLNYLFKSMGYSNGFKDAHAGLFSEDVLAAGTSGILGLGKQHHYEYAVLNTSERDRSAFRIQSANGTVVHFMKTCGNYMYACN